MQLDDLQVKFDVFLHDGQLYGGIVEGSGDCIVGVGLGIESGRDPSCGIELPPLERERRYERWEGCEGCGGGGNEKLHVGFLSSDAGWGERMSLTDRYKHRCGPIYMSEPQGQSV
jgi:hypothetical protein